MNDKGDTYDCEGGSYAQKIITSLYTIRFLLYIIYCNAYISSNASS